MSVDKMIEEITGGSKPPAPDTPPEKEAPKEETKVVVKVGKTVVEDPTPEEEEDRELAALPPHTAARVRAYRAKMAAKRDRAALAARK